MKKILFLLLLTVSSYAQTYQNPTFGTVTTKTNIESTTATKISVQETDGKINWLQPVNIPIVIPPHPINYTVTAPTLGAHLEGIDNKLGTIVATTAGVTTRVWFTADAATITAGTFYLTNATSKGTAASAIQNVVNDDNQKKYFAQDLIGNAFATATIFPVGVYAGNLSASTSPNSAQQRWTVELYKCNNAGTPIASGITGAPVGSLGVTVITILDSGLLTLVDGSVTNVQVSGNLASPLSMAVGERIRYHVSAEKVGTAASNITQSVYYGTSYNSFLDVPVPLNTTAVQNLSGVAGATTTDALNTLNTGKANDADVVHKTGSETIYGKKRFNDNAIFGATEISGFVPLYHLTEFNAPSQVSPIALSGGTSSIEFWRDSTVPSYAWGLGLRNPSNHAEVKDSFKFTVSDAGAPYSDVLEITDNGNLYTKGVLSENITTINPTISGQVATIKYVNSLNATQPTKLIIYFHGSGVSQLNPFSEPNVKYETDRLLAQGYILASSEAHGDAWGNQTSQNDYLALYNYINTNYNISEVAFIGHSMGGLAALTMLSKNTITKATSFYGIFPVTNLSWAYFSGGFSSAIETAYGFSGSGNYATATAGNDPNALTTSTYYGRKYRFVASPSDVVVPKVSNSDLFVTKLNTDGRIYASAITASGNHGDASHFIPKDAFLFIKNDVDSRINTNFLPKLDVNGTYSNSEVSMTGNRVDISTFGTSGNATAVPKLAIYNGDGSQNGAGGIEIKNNSGANGFAKRIQSYFDGVSDYTFSIQSRSNSINWTNQLELSATGVFKINNLSGTGNRQVITDANGNLSATSTQPLKYVALISQTGTSAPVATVLDNTLGGAIVWTRSSTGIYIGTLSGAFTASKTIVLYGNSVVDTMITGYSNTTNTISLSTSTAANVLKDGALANATIKIEVYP